MFLIKALDWDRRKNKKDNSQLLRGSELREAEQELASAHNGTGAQPTELQRQFVLASRQYEEQLRRQITFGLAFAFLVMALLAVSAWNQRNNALRQAEIALAFSPDGKYVASATGPTILLLDAASGEEISRMNMTHPEIKEGRE